MLNKHEKWKEIKVRKFPDYNYHAIWHNLKTLRLGKGVAKELPPDKAEFYDVSLGTKCNLECPFCYTNAKGNGMLYDNIVEKAKFFFGDMSDNDKSFQIAIGSQGEPTIHPQFIEFLETIYNLGIVPNYTTNGITIGNDDEYSKQLLEQTAKFCGGVAVSANTWNEQIDVFWRKAVNKLSQIDININIHYIIKNKQSVDEFIKIYDEYKDKVLYFVLLPLMDSGRSTEKCSEEAFEYLMTFNDQINTEKIAFGAHFYNSLIKHQDKIKCWLYPPESLSKNLILDDIIKITASSFHSEPLMEIPFKKIEETLYYEK